MSSIISCGGRPSTVQPMFCAVPKISLAVPLNSRAIERVRKAFAMLIMSSNVMLPLCLTVKDASKQRRNEFQYKDLCYKEQSQIDIE